MSSTQKQGHYNVALLTKATSKFCTGIMTRENVVILEDIMSPDCRVSQQGGCNDHAATSKDNSSEVLIQLQNTLIQFQERNCLLRRGLKVNEKKQKTRLLMIPRTSCQRSV